MLDETPPSPVIAGRMWTRSGHLLECIEVKPHVRKDGVLTSLLVIGTTCDTCGIPFAATVRLAFDDSMISRWCGDHRKAGLKQARMARIRSGTETGPQ